MDTTSEAEPCSSLWMCMKPIRGLTSRIELHIFYVEASSCLGKQIYSSVFCKLMGPCASGDTVRKGFGNYIKLSSKLKTPGKITKHLPGHKTEQMLQRSRDSCSSATLIHSLLIWKDSEALWWYKWWKSFTKSWMNLCVSSQYQGINAPMKSINGFRASGYSLIYEVLMLIFTEG